MKFVYKSIEYKLSDWIRSYQGSDGYQTPTSICRLIDSKKVKPSPPYLPWSEDEIGLYLPLTSSIICYEVYGEGIFKSTAKLYNETYKKPIYKSHEVGAAMNHIDDFLIKLPNLIAYI